MSLFNRWMVAPGANLGHKSLMGQGIPFALKPSLVATNADMTATVAQMAGGAIIYTSLSAGRSVTTPTAALILAAATSMDIGETFSFFVSAQAAFAVTWVAGVGVTLAGRATTPASSWSLIVVEKTSATTVTWTVF